MIDVEAYDRSFLDLHTPDGRRCWVRIGEVVTIIDGNEKQYTKLFLRQDEECVLVTESLGEIERRLEDLSRKGRL